MVERDARAPLTRDVVDTLEPYLADVDKHVVGASPSAQV